MVHSIADGGECQAILSKNQLVMLKFSAKWCGPCRVVAPIIDRMATQYSKVFMADVDVDDVPDVAQMYKVTAMPTFVFFNSGIEINRVRGADINAISGILKEMTTMAQGYGRGERLGSASSTTTHSSLADATLLRDARLRKRETVTTNKAKPATKEVQASSSQWLSNLLQYFLLYISTLFSQDARGAAAKMAAST